MSARAAREVLDDHLRRAREGDVEGDLRDNYAEDVVFLTPWGVHRGHDGARTLYERLRSKLGEDAEFDYAAVHVDGDVGFLRWNGRSSTAHVDDGADSYVIRDGKVRAQTISYSARPP